MTPHHEDPLPIRSNGIKNANAPHPLEPLSCAEHERARQTIIAARGNDVLIQFRSIFLEEPPKPQLIAFLEAEHAGGVTTQTPRPARQAMVHYDVVKSDKSHEYTHSLVELPSGEEKMHRVIDKMHQAALTT
jgi:primary-amine oxidase